MNSSTLHSSRTRWSSLAFVALAAFLAGSPSVEAGLTLESSSGSVTYGIFNTSAGSLTTTYGQNNGSYTNLSSPGDNLPMLGNLVAGTSQVSTASTLSPYFLSTATTTPASFGSATTEMYTANSGQQGGFTTQGGVYWSLSTNLADNLSAPNQASVDFSIATATYENMSAIPVTFTPGAVLSVVGSLGSSSSFVAAGLATTISYGYGEDNTTTVLDTITLAANGSGTTIAAHGTSPNEFAGVSILGTATLGVSKLTGTGTSLDSETVTLYQFETITITSYMTLISDPGSNIGISNQLYGGFPSGSQYIPTFGSYGSSPDAVVPEPSTIAMMGAGLAMAGLWGRSRRRRRPAKA